MRDYQRRNPRTVAIEQIPEHWDRCPGRMGPPASVRYAHGPSGVASVAQRDQQSPPRHELQAPETIARWRRGREKPTIPIRPGILAAATDFDELRAGAREEYRKLQLHPVQNLDDGASIAFTRPGWKELLWHSADRRILELTREIAGREYLSLYDTPLTEAGWLQQAGRDERDQNANPVTHRTPAAEADPILLRIARLSKSSHDVIKGVNAALAFRLRELYRDREPQWGRG